VQAEARVATAEDLLSRIPPLELPALPRPRIVLLVRPSSAFEPAEASMALASSAEAAIDPASARREGVALHALLQHLATLDGKLRERIAMKALAVLLPEAAPRHAPLAAKAISILERPELAHLFGRDSRAEVPFLVRARRRGEPVTLAGRIDRLVVGADRVLVVDFKSDAEPARDVAQIPPAYVTQLGLYALVAGQLFQGMEVRAAILWTSLESLVELPRHALVEATSAFTMR
jgi:ATP-dependent helicase/nuclease subunit A